MFYSADPISIHEVPVYMASLSVKFCMEKKYIAWKISLVFAKIAFLFRSLGKITNFAVWAKI